jgi:hypothetical protein
MRLRIAILALGLASTAALAADAMKPADIKATFFNGQPFTAASPTGAKFKMTFTPDGKALREPLNAAAESAASTSAAGTKAAGAKTAGAKTAGAKTAGAKTAGAKAAGAKAAGASAADTSAANTSAANTSAAGSAATSGTWKLSPTGFCTAWAGAKPSCFTLVPMSDNRWSVQRLATTISVSVAIWTKQ